MLQECLDVFEKMLKEKGDTIITDAYVPKNGTYKLIEISDAGFVELEPMIIYNDKKKGIITGSLHENYSYICMLDYYSKLVDMNKPLDSKKIIHTNNFLSLAVKKESIAVGKLTKDVIDNYYNILKNPRLKYEKKAKTRELYKKVEENIGKPDIELISKIQTYVMEKNIWENMDLDKKDYGKIFFVFQDKEKTKEYYVKENKRYLIPNVYNNNDFNVLDETVILGLPNNNMGMNSKKPYLENKTRKVSVPNLIAQEKALLQNQLFDYFMAKVSQGKNNIYIQYYGDDYDIKAYSSLEEPQALQCGYFFKMNKEKNEVSIQWADTITDYNPNLKKDFILNDYIELPKETSDVIKEKYGCTYNRIWKVKGLLDTSFFEGKLKYSFDSEELSFRDSKIKQNFLLCREPLMSWFWEGNDSDLYPVLDKMTLQLIKNSILNGRDFEARHQFNIRWSLLQYLKEDRRIGEDMREIRKRLREHINLDRGQDWDFDSDDEFSYAVGQLVSYMYGFSNAREKDESIINTFLNAKNITVVRNKIQQLFIKYNYKIIHDKAFRFRGMAAAILEYQPKKINNEMIMAGFLANSLIHEKKNNESEENENE